MSDDCLFCRIVQGKIPAKKAYEDDEILGFHDIAPKAPLHLLFITKAHFRDARELKDPALFGRLCRAAVLAAEQSPEAKRGFRLVMNTGAEAGQSVFHVHLHLLAGKPLAWG